MLRKLGLVERNIEAKKGPLELFGLFLREDVEGWEVVGSASWLNEGLAGKTYVAGELHKVMTLADLMKIAGIVLLEPKAQFVTALRAELSGRETPVELRNVVVDEQRIKQAFVLTLATRNGKGRRGK